MTRVGKCDICRERKVKCDETRPKCGQCTKKNRPCSYQYGKVTKFIDGNAKRGDLDIGTASDSGHSSDTSRRSDPWRSSLSPTRQTGPRQKRVLAIKSAKEANAGDGIFHIFSLTSLGDIEIRKDDSDPGRGDASTISPSISSSNSSLRAQFIEALGAIPVERNASLLWGFWVSSIPSRIGINRAFDDAAACFIAGGQVYRKLSTANDVAARKQYSKALLSLQGVLMGPDETQKLSSETLAAIKMLAAFETFLGLWNNRWLFHSRALTDLLLAKGPDIYKESMNRSLFYSSLPHEFTEAVFNGTDSTFDSPSWLSPTFSDSVEEPYPAAACRVVIQLLIRLPRLIRLVRELRETSNDTQKIQDATALAEELFMTRIEPFINGETPDYCYWVPTEEPGLANHYPESMDFHKISGFEMVTRYSYCRILVIGLCRALREMFSFSLDLDNVELDVEEIHSASMLVMSAQYAEKLVNPFPLGSLLMILPLQVAFGAWWRAIRDDAGRDDEEHHKARYMREWCKEKSNEMLNIWKGREMSTSKLEEQTRAMEGGPLMSWMTREIVPL